MHAKIPKRKVILIIRDGWGYSKEKKGNAPLQAKTPNNDKFIEKYPWTFLECSGNAVGLPKGTQGGSEPGHLTMGAGRVVWQPYEDINRKIKNKDFFKNPALLSAINNCKKNNSNLHLMGLFSDEGVHGTVEHLYALMELAKKHGLNQVFIHAILDGRDVPERSAGKFIEKFRKKSKEIGIGKIASIVGRYYGMDRDTNWDRTEQAYKLFINGEGFRETDPKKAISNAYKRGDKTDYYIKPIIIVNGKNKPLATVEDNDSIIFWNFRSDRSRQIMYALTQDKFNNFNRGIRKKICFVCMSRYDRSINLPVAFEQHDVINNIGNVFSKHNIKQLRISETEKYAHVTFFFNSQHEKPEPGEDRIMIPSPKIPSYDKKPEMSAYGIRDKLIKEIGKEKYDFILINFANCDLVGHSASLDAGIKACEAVDTCVGDIVDAAKTAGYVCIVTGDHGNAECMFYPDGEPNPSHGTNPVPFMIVSEEECLVKAKLLPGMGLKDISPTVLSLMGIEKPKEMTGKSIIKSL